MPYEIFENRESFPKVYVLSQTPYKYNNYDIIDEEEYDNLFDAISDSIEQDKKQQDVLIRAFYFVEDLSRFRYSMDERDIEIIELENDYRREESVDLMYDSFNLFDPDDEIKFVSLPISIQRGYMGPPEEGEPPITYGADLVFYYRPGGEGLEEGIASSPLSDEEKRILTRKIRSIGIRKNMF